MLCTVVAGASGGDWHNGLSICWSWCWDSHQIEYLRGKRNVCGRAAGQQRVGRNIGGDRRGSWRSCEPWTFGGHPRKWMGEWHEKCVSCDIGRELVQEENLLHHVHPTVHVELAFWHVLRPRFQRRDRMRPKVKPHPMHNSVCAG